MAKIGIVGSESKKFTIIGEQHAREIIRELLAPPDSILVSGHCHLGGIDIYAEEEALVLGREALIFPPKSLMWSTGYKPRNLQIANNSDIVHCITVDRLPSNYKGMTFNSCYHCNRNDHVKSGGCWTMLRCRKHELHIVSNF